MNNKGVSGVIIVVLIVLIALVAITIIGTIVINFARESAQRVEAGASSVRLSILPNSISYNQDDKDNNRISLSVQRNQGLGNLIGVDIILEDANGKRFVHRVNQEVGELGTISTGVVSYGTNIGEVAKIRVAPVVKGDSGKEFVGEAIAEYIVQGNLVPSGEEPGRHTLMITVSGSGSGAVSGAGITCGYGGQPSPCSININDGSSITLSASPGSSFGGWSGSGISCPGTGVCQFIMNEDKSVTAIFSGGSGNNPPLVSLTSPSDGQTYTAPATVILTATASDSDGSISQVDFLSDSSAVCQPELSAPYECTWSGVAAGTYSLTAKATDNQGAITTSSPRSITVNPASSGNPGIPSAGQVVWYKFDSNLDDSSINNAYNHPSGSAVGSISYLTGAKGNTGNSLSLAGSSYINIPGFQWAISGPTKPVTVIFWIKASNPNPGFSAFWAGGENIGGGWASTTQTFHFFHSGGTHIWDYGSTTGSGRLTSSGSLSSWTHVALVSSSSGMLIYINGQPVASKESSSVPPTLNELMIGATPNPSWPKLNGQLDEFMIYDRAMDSLEIQGIYDSYQ